jgi:plasmid stabilization system protein ParE
LKPHYFHPDAADEYAAAADYYFKIQPGLGGRLYDEIERLIETVCRQPGLFRFFDPPARRHFSTVFPYAVIYIDQPGRIWIVAVMNCKKRPGY